MSTSLSPILSVSTEVVSPPTLHSARVGWSRVVRGEDAAGAHWAGEQMGGSGERGMGSVCRQLHTHLAAAQRHFGSRASAAPFRVAAVPDVPHPLHSGNLGEVRRGVCAQLIKKLDAV